MELAPQELKPLKNGDVDIFKRSLLSYQIKNSSENDLKSVLRQVMLKVGLRAANLPNDEEKQILLAFINQNYGNHTTGEIILAFDLAIAGKLDLKEVNCYENFSCLYFALIMNAYRKWASVQVRYIPDEVQSQLSEPPPKQSNGEFVAFWLNEWKESATKNYFLFGQFTKIYEILADNNLIDLTEKEKESIKAKVKNDLMNSCSTENEIVKMRKNISNENYLKPHCKKLAVANYFNKLIG
jgi:hypothetical protein